jgi:hypothetical protein
MPDLDPEVEIMFHLLTYLEDFGRDIRQKHPRVAEAALRNPNPYSPTYEIVNLGVPYAPARWLDGALSEAGRMAFSRAVKHLSKLRLIVPEASNGRRTTHVRPTARGVTIAVKVLWRMGEVVDLDALSAALSVAKWATPEHLAAVAGLRPEPAPEGGDTNQPAAETSIGTGPTSFAWT